MLKQASNPQDTPAYAPQPPIPQALIQKGACTQITTPKRVSLCVGVCVRVCVCVCMCVCVLCVCV
jgi:hypothetical protein